MIWEPRELPKNKSHESYFLFYEREMYEILWGTPFLAKLRSGLLKSYDGSSVRDHIGLDALLNGYLVTSRLQKGSPKSCQLSEGSRGEKTSKTKTPKLRAIFHRRLCCSRSRFARFAQEVCRRRRTKSPRSTRRHAAGPKWGHEAPKSGHEAPTRPSSR